MRLLFAFITKLREIGSDLEALSEASVRLSDDSMPEPDIVLTRFKGDRWMSVESVALIVEIVDTTLETDLGRKSDLYAAAGVPEYWVIDLNGNRMLGHELPEADGYRGQIDVPFGDLLHSATIEGLSVETANLVDPAS